MMLMMEIAGGIALGLIGGFVGILVAADVIDKVLGWRTRK